MSRRLAVFPGTFDPIHNGHLDLIRRGAKLFDVVQVAILHNPAKQPLFSLDERIALLEEVLAEEESCVVDSFSGLLVEYAAKLGAVTILRGLRTGADLDYELPMTRMNRRLQPDLDTVFLLPDLRFADLSSSLIKEVAGLGGEIDGLVPPVVAARLRAKVGR